MKSTRFSSSAGTPRTCARNKAKKKTAPGPLRPGSDTKQKKRAHLAHANLAQIRSKKKVSTWPTHLPSYQTKKTVPDTKQKKESSWLTPTWLRYQAEKKRAPGPLQPSLDTLMFIRHYLFFFLFTQKRKFKKLFHASPGTCMDFFFIFLVFSFSTHVLSTCLGTYALLKSANFNCRRFSRVHNHGFVLRSDF